MRGALVALALGLAGGYLILQVGYNNEALARRITERFNRERRGRLEIERVSWGVGALWAYVASAPARVTVTGLVLRDSRGRVVLSVPRAEIEIRPRELLGEGSVEIRALRVPGGWMSWERYRRPDGPSPSGATVEIGVLGALERRRPPPARGAPPASPERPTPARDRSAPMRFVNIDDLQLTGLTLRLHHPLGEAELQGVAVRGGLQHRQGGGRPDTLTVDLRATADRGRLWANHREVPLHHVTLTAESGAGQDRDPLEISGELDALGARLSLVGMLRGLPNRPHPTARVSLHALHFGPLLQRLGLDELHEDGSRLAIQLYQRRGAWTVQAQLGGVGWGTQWGAPHLQDATVVYRDGRVLLQSARVQAWGGTFLGTGWVAPDTWRYGFDAQLLALNAPWYLRRHMQEVDLEISGLVHGTGSLRGKRRSRAYVTVAATRRTEASPLPQMLSLVASLSGSRRRLRLEQLTVFSELGILMTRGVVRLPRPRIDLRLQLHAWNLRRHLTPLGHRIVIDGVDLTGRLDGPGLDPRFAGQLTLRDFRTPLLRVRELRSPVAFREGTLVATELRSRRHARYLRARVRLTVYQGSFRHLQRPDLDFSWTLGLR